VFFDVLTDSKSDAEGLKLVLNQRRGHEILRVTVILSVLPDGGKLTPFVTVKRKYILMGKLPGRIIFTCNEEFW
jgi:hypothetical protein